MRAWLPVLSLLSLLATAACGSGSDASTDVAAEASDLVEADVGGGATFEIEAPAEGLVVLPGTAVAFQVRTTCLGCSVAVTSGVMGELFEERPSSSGLVVRSVSDLSPGIHVLALRLLHPDGRELRAATRTVRVDRVPGAPVVHLEPASPTTTDGLTVVFDAYAIDPDGDAVSYLYRWSRDGELALENTSKTLSSSLTARGETWSVAVVPRDPWGEGPAGSAEVLIVDSAPAVETVVVLPSVGTVTTRFSCAWYGWSDPDAGDPEEPRVVFLRNGVELGPPGASPVFPDGHARGDRLACRVIPFDGELEGPPVESPPVLVADAEPTVASVTLSPPEGDVTATFTCTAEGVVDPDGDEVDLAFRWRVDGTLLPGETSASVAGSLFQRGQRLRCEVVPSDGSIDGLPVASNEVVLADAPPSLTAAMLSPVEADEATVLTCTPGSASDPDGDEIAFLYRWRVDGAPQDGPFGPTLTGASFDKGQAVECAVVPEANGLQGPEIVAKPVVSVVNTPPALAGAALEPAEGGRQTLFTCVRGALLDPDPLDDPLTWGTLVDPLDTAVPGLTLDWYVNGQKQAGQHGETFRPVDAAPGQQVRCRIGAHDGQEAAVPVDSPAVTLSNHAPTLADVTLTPVEPREGDVLLCSANQGLDPDGDAVALQITWLVDGQEVAGQEQAQLDGGSFDEGDDVACRVTPIDMYGLAGAAVASPVVTVRNSAPAVATVWLSPTAGGPGTVFTCSFDGLADPDPADVAQALFSWRRNGQVVEGQGSATYAAGSAVAGETVRCTVTPFDGTVTGIPVDSAIVTLQNQPPAVAAVRVEPADLTTLTPATCVVEGASDPEGAPVTLSWAWYVNSTLQADVTGDTLDAERISRGDAVFCVATPSDGTQQGSALASAPVVVANSAPGPFDVAVVPGEPGFEDPAVTCVRLSEPGDADGDPPTFAYAWSLVEGAALGGGESLATDGLARCDLLRCSATASDGYGGQATAVSAPVVYAGTFGAGFDGAASRLTVSATGALDTTAALTLEAWVRPAVQGAAPVAARGLTGASRYELGLAASGAVRFTLSTGGAGAGTVELLSTSLATAGEWTHVAGTWDGAVARLFVQGALQAGAPVAGFLAPAGDLVLGAPPFAGALDDVRLSSVARYAASFEPPATATADAGTLLLYPLERVSLHGVLDAGPAGLDGAAIDVTDVVGACFESGLPDRPPTAPGVAVTPLAPTDDEDVLCRVTAPSTDPEGATVGYSPLWYVNGLRLADLDGAWTLPAGRTAPCDLLTCRVLPTAGALTGPWGEAGVQVEAPIVDEVLKYHAWPDPPPPTAEQKWIPWDGAFVYGQTFRFDQPVKVLGVRYFQRGTYNTGSGRLRWRFDHGPPYDWDEPHFGTLVPGSSTGSEFTSTVAPGWNTYLYPTPLLLDEPVVVMWTFSTSGGATSDRRIYFDDEPAPNPETVNWIFSSSYIEQAQVHDPVVTGNFLIELVIEGDQAGACP